MTLAADCAPREVPAPYLHNFGRFSTMVPPGTSHQRTDIGHPPHTGTPWPLMWRNRLLFWSAPSINHSSASRMAGRSQGVPRRNKQEDDAGDDAYNSDPNDADDDGDNDRKTMMMDDDHDDDGGGTHPHYNEAKSALSEWRRRRQG